MNRRRFLIGAAAVTLAPDASLEGTSLFIEGRERALTDILTPATNGAGKEADFFAAAISEILRQGTPSGPAPIATDRWGRGEGAIFWRLGEGRETTVQEMLLSQGAARVAPQSDDFPFIERCFAAERAARDANLGLWAEDAWRIRDASKSEPSSGFQIYAGVIRSANERKSRVFFNFGEDFRSDFTASVARGAFRRWKQFPDIASLAGRRAEVRGYVESINGPSIELTHPLQLRLA
ncbi:MAG: thermonuclease family protein [Pseudomonadota bacterium]